MKPACLNTRRILLAGIVGMAAFIFLDQLRFPDSSKNFLGDTKRAELSVNGPIIQTFHAKEDGLEGLQVFMGDTELGFGERIDFALLDASCETVIHQASRNAFSLPAIRDIRFVFPAIPASANKPYCFSVEYHPGFMEKKERPYIRVAEDEQFKDLSYVDRGKEKTYAGRTLEIRPLYAPERGGATARITVLENRLSQYKPAFAKGSMLALGASGFFLATVFFVWIARRED